MSSLDNVCLGFFYYQGFPDDMIDKLRNMTAYPSQATDFTPGVLVGLQFPHKNDVRFVFTSSYL
jgi:hypothetical protein